MKYKIFSGAILITKFLEMYQVKFKLKIFKAALSFINISKIKLIP
jgi:hypothetical protein